MKIKKMSILLAVLALTLYSCSKEDPIASSPPVETRDIRATNSYVLDEVILQDYVRIDKEHKQYYMDYTGDTASLAQVKPENKKRFENRLNNINLSIREAIRQNDQSVYLETRNDRYFSDQDNSITTTQNPNTQPVNTVYLNQNQTSVSDFFYNNNQKLHSIIRVSTTSYDEPIQMTILLKDSFAGKGTKRKVFVTSTLRVINALINWTYKYPNKDKSIWPLDVTKNKSTSGYISFYPGHIGSLFEIQ
ncbi:MULTISPECIES: hypothetical protein [unclassified Myroides]|uniref:hypothetical protein n=1 Tax=unclassified Myroides TaxID=2642485 RepID=UPI003D2F6DD9